MKEIISNRVDAKLALLSNDKTQKQLMSGYVVAFVHPQSKELIFLANCANIADICYSEYPQLPGTRNVKLAKMYADLDSVKSDIYLLRYHHRQFLKILTVAKPAIQFQAQLELYEPDSELVLYNLPELVDPNLSENLGN